MRDSGLLSRRAPQICDELGNFWLHIGVENMNNVLSIDYMSKIKKSQSSASVGNEMKQWHRSTCV